MIFTYIIVFLFIILLAMIVMYVLNTFVIPRRIDEIAQMIETGQIKLAIKKLTDLLEKDDRNSYAHFLLAEAQLKDNNPKFAIVEFRQVLKYGKYNEKFSEVDVRSRLAKLYLDQGQIEDAKSEFLILTKLEPDNFKNFFELGSIYFRSNALDRATVFFKKSISLNPRDEQSLYYLGQIYYQNNLYSDAKQAFLEAIKADPTNYRAHYFLGLVLRQIQDYEWAIKEFEIAQKSEELKVKCFLAKGSCHMQKGMIPKAMMEFERGLKFARKGSDTELGLRYYLADCYEKTRDLHSAIYQWEKIIETKPNFRDVQAKLKNYSEFRQDDRIKDFLISGLAQFEHTCRKVVEAMNFSISDVNIISDTEIEIIASESEGKWRNTRATNRVIRVLRTTDVIQEKLLRSLHESMKSKNATRIIVITTGEFAQSALDFANTRPIELYGKNELVNMLRKF
ncbi:MAG: tetratricopeptide repeat protein [Spirochaetes bacterium]|nr:tetratricopeptide repeat protein [Spirochaetota bacterium]